MSISFLTLNRTVLLISDEALHIYSSGSSGVRLVETVPWDAHDFQQNVAHVIAKDCKGRPILILNDMVEQHYRKERIMRKGVGFMDKASMLKRKLNATFPNYPVRAAYPLKEKIDKNKKTQSADIYIFAAVPGTEQFSQTMGAASQSFASIAGFCLLPVESSDMVKTLSDKLANGKKSSAKWAIFMGQHKNGGLRQIVTKDGELALTRMTPVTNIEKGVDLWVNDVAQEFKATMSYLARFGYQEEEGLDVIVIGDPAAEDALKGQIEDECNFHFLSADVAAKLLGLSFARGEDDRYAESLHIAWVAKKTKFILPMSAAQLETISKPRQVAMLGAMMLLAVSGYFGYELFNEIASISSINKQIDIEERQKAQLDVQYQREVKRKEELGFDVRLVQSSIAVNDEFKSEELKALKIFSAIGYALGKDLRIDRVEMKREAEKKVPMGFDAGYGQQNQEPKNKFSAKMVMTFPSTTDVDKGNAEVKQLAGRLAQRLPGLKVDVTKYLKDYEYVEEIIVESGDLDNKAIEQDFVAEIQIKGELGL